MVWVTQNPPDSCWETRWWCGPQLGLSDLFFLLRSHILLQGIGAYALHRSLLRSLARLPEWLPSIHHPCLAALGKVATHLVGFKGPAPRSVFASWAQYLFFFILLPFLSTIVGLVFPLSSCMLSHSSGRLLQSVASSFALFFMCWRWFSCLSSASFFRTSNVSVSRPLPDFFPTSCGKCFSRLRAEVHASTRTNGQGSCRSSVHGVLLLAAWFQSVRSALLFFRHLKASVHEFVVPAFFPLFFRVISQVDLHLDHDRPVVFPFLFSDALWNPPIAVLCVGTNRPRMVVPISTK